MMYCITLPNSFEFNMYSAHTKQYSPESLLMASIEAKNMLKTELLDHYNGNLQLAVKITPDKYDTVYCYIDFHTRDVYMYCTQEGFITQCMYGEHNITTVSNDKKELFPETEMILRYIMSFHCFDIIALCNDVFERVRLADNHITQFIKQFQEMHKENSHD